MLLIIANKRCFIILLAFVLWFNNTQAQRGSPYITNFSTSDRQDNRIWDIIQTSNEEMLFATKRGYLSFNGSDWKMHRSKYPPLVFSYNSNNEIIQTVPGGFGKVSMDSAGSYKYYPLFKNDGNDFLGEIVKFDSKLAITGDSSIYILDKNDSIIRVKTSEDIFPVSGSFAFQNELYVITHNKMYLLDKDTLLFQNGVIFPLINEYIFHIESRDSNAYFANTNSKLFEFDGKKIRKIYEENTAENFSGK